MNFSQSIVAAAVAALSLSATQQAVAWDPATDLASSFPAIPAPWSYGYNSTSPVGYNFQTFNAQHPNFPTLSGFHHTSYTWAGNTPTVANYSGTTPPSWISTGQMLLHPGPATSEDEAILRFTAPWAALYHVSLQMLAGDSGETEGWVYLNGSILQPLGITSLNPSYTNAALSLLAGDRLDVVVGSFNGDYNFDSTPIRMKITAVPEPSALALVAVALAALGLSRRRSFASVPGAQAGPEGQCFSPS